MKIFSALIIILFNWSAHASFSEKSCLNVSQLVEVGGCFIEGSRSYTMLKAIGSMSGDTRYITVGTKGGYYVRLFPVSPLSEAASNSEVSSALHKVIVIVDGFGVDIDLDDEDEITDEGVEFTNIEERFNTVITNAHANGISVLITRDMHGGLSYIQSSGFALIDVVEFLNSNRSNFNPMSIFGYSAGGVITRIALTRMESEGIEHNVGVFISYDSPHQGAYIPLALQPLFTGLAGAFDKFADKLDQWTTFADFIGADRWYWTEEYVDSAEGDKYAALDAKRKFNMLGSDSIESTAAQQLLKEHYLGDTLHTTLYEELLEYGYPEQSKNIAATNASDNGTLNDSIFEDTFWSYHGRVNRENQLTIALNKAQESGNYTTEIKIRYGGAAFFDENSKFYNTYNDIEAQYNNANGSFFDWGGTLQELGERLNEDFADETLQILPDEAPTLEFTFIPTNSALDIVNGTSPFDKTVFIPSGEENLSHLDIRYTEELFNEVNRNNNDWLIPVITSLIL